MNNLSLRPRPWINYTNIQVITLLTDHKTFSHQSTLLSDPKWSAQYQTHTITTFNTLYKKPFENTAGKEENAGNKHFLLFPQCY